MADWHTRYRRIIDVYRSALHAASPNAGRLIDTQVEQMGEGWVCNDDQVSTQQWVTPKQIREQFGIEPQTIYKWHRRHPDRINRMKARDSGRVYFWLADILRYRAEKDSR